MKRGTPPPQIRPWPVSPAVLEPFAPGAWNVIFARVDPYADDSRSALQAAALVFAQSQWQALRALYPAEAPAELVARNAWVGIERGKRDYRPVLALTLRLAVPAAPWVDELCAALRAARRERVAQEAWHWVDVVLGAADVRCDTVGIGGIAGQEALRWALATAHRRGLRRAAELVEILNLHPGAPRREMGQAVREFLEHTTIDPLTAREVARLPARLQVLLAEQAALRSALLGDAAESTLPVLDAGRARWRAQRTLRGITRALCRHLQRRELLAADAFAAELVDLPWEPAALDGLHDEVAAALASPSLRGRSADLDWPARYRSLALVLPRIAPANPTAALLASTPRSIAAQAVVNAGFRVAEHLPAHDLSLLCTMWTARETAALIRAGRFELLPDDRALRSRAEVRALLGHLDHPRAALLLVNAVYIGLGDPLLRALDASPRLRELLAEAARSHESVVNLLLRRLGDPVVNDMLPVKLLAQGNRVARAIEHWRRQPPGARKKRAMTTLADVIATLSPRQATVALAKFVDMGPGAAKTLARRLGAGGFAGLLPALPSDHWAHAEAERAALLTEAILAGLDFDDPAATWRVLRKQPRFLLLLEGRQPPTVSSDSPLPLLALHLLVNHTPARILQLRSLVGQAHFAAAAREVLPLLPAHAPGTALLDLAAWAPGIELMPLVRVFGAARFEAAPGCKLDHCYHTYPLPKKAGGKRRITVPPVWLRSVQRQIYKALLLPLGHHEAAHGFVPKRSIVTNARPHVGHPVVVNCDIANCFPSVRRPLVLAALRRDLGAKLRDATLRWLADICCHNGALPVGAPSSPALLNRVLARTDVYLSAQAARRNAVYTRYADDLSFSGDDRAVGLLRIAASSLQRIGLTLDRKKTNLYRGGRRQMVTGLVVNRRVSVPRRIRRRLRAAVHAIEQGRNPTWHGEPVTEALVRGWLAFARHVNEEEAQRLLDRLAARVAS